MGGGQMYIKRMDIKKYRLLENVSLGSFLPPKGSSEVVVLAGPNGGGKSSILELISIALSNAWSLTFKMNRTQPDSSFEVQLGLSDKEVELISSYDTANETEKVALEQLKTKKYYCRGFKYPEGEYEKESTTQNAMHSIVQRVLKEECNRPLGFNLGSDRIYQKEAFKNDSIFQYQQFTQLAYIWNFAFQTSSEQYKDMFQFLVTWRHYFYRRLGIYVVNKEHGQDNGEARPTDVYGDILKDVFPGYEFYDQEEGSPTDLFVRIPSGDIIPFSDLSSGEKEAFFTLCFFQRHNVEDAIISIDEPDLHLHPSLARQLVSTMQYIKPRNQIWLATHNSEIIEEAGRENVWFIRRSDKTNCAEILHSVDEGEQLQALRDFFGYYGFIGLARKMVFLEGEDASADRKTFVHLFPEYSRDLKFIPASSCSQMERLNSAILSLLEANLGYCEFFLIKDRDYMAEEMVSAQESRGDGRLIVLKKHEIENYLIDFDIIAKVQEETFGKATTPSEVKDAFKEIARKMAGRVLRDMVTYRMCYLMNTSNLSIGKLYQTEELMGEDFKWESEKVDSLSSKFKEQIKTITDMTAETRFSDYFSKCKQEVEDALNSEQWLDLFPGKELIIEYSKKIGLGKEPTFINSIIRELRYLDKIPSELKKIVDNIMSYS